MRARSDANPIQLFTFLDVLISAMGSLFLVLLSIPKHAELVNLAKEPAVEIPAEYVPPALDPLPPPLVLAPLPPLPPVIMPARIRAEPLPDLSPIPDPRPAARKKVEQLKERLALARANAPESPVESERLGQLANQLELLKDKLHQISEEQKKLATGMEEKAAERRELQDRQGKIRRRGTEVESRYAIVPYVGPNGTARRPIFLECNAKGITLQPEGITLTKDMLSIGNGRDHPLLLMVESMMRAIGLDDPAGVPYPLLLVRPDGIATYWDAQAILRRAQVAMGYELVDSDLELAYPAADPKVAAAASAVVTKVEERLAELASLPSYGGGNGASRSGRGRDGNDLNHRDPLGTGSGSNEMRRSIRENGTGAVSVGSGAPGTGSKPNPEGTGGIAKEGRPETAAGDSNDISRIVRDFHAGPAERSGHGGFFSATGRKPRASSQGQEGTGNRRAIGAESSRSSLDGNGTDSDGSMANRPLPLGKGAHDRVLDTSFSVESDTDSSFGHAGESPRGLSNGGPQADRGSNGFGPASASGMGSVTRGTPSEAAGEGGVGLAAGSSNGGGKSSSSTGVGRGAGSTDTSNVGNDSASTTAGDGARAAAGSSSGNSSGSPGMGNGTESGNPAPPGMMPMSISLGAPTNTQEDKKKTRPNIDFERDVSRTGSASSSTEAPLVDDPETGDGESFSGGWAPLGTGKQPVRREVVIECRRDGIVLHPEDRLIPLTGDQDIAAATRAILDFVRQQASQWSPPGPLHRWQPVAVCLVRPEGLANYYRLRLQLVGSRVELDRRLIDDDLLLEFPNWEPTAITPARPLPSRWRGRS